MILQELEYIPRSEKNYRRINERQVRSTSLPEAIAMSGEIFDILYSQTRSVMSQRAFGIVDITAPPEIIDEAITQLEERGFTENNSTNTSLQKPLICGQKLPSEQVENALGPEGVAEV